MLFLNGTRVKICCIASIDEARLAIGAGAAAIGLVAQMPSGPGPIDDHLIRDIAAAVPPPIAAFLLTSRTDAAGIADHARSTGCGTVQIVDRVDPSVRERLRARVPAVRIVQVVHVQDENSISESIEAARFSHALLLDSGRPAAAVRELGGTGRTHDWSLSRRIRERAPVPLFLAGGLNPSNVADAIAEVRPFGVDVCSGLRTDGRLDPARLKLFARAVDGARPRA